MNGWWFVGKGYIDCSSRVWDREVFPSYIPGKRPPRQESARPWRPTRLTHRKHAYENSPASHLIRSILRCPHLFKTFPPLAARRPAREYLCEYLAADFRRRAAPRSMGAGSYFTEQDASSHGTRYEDISHAATYQTSPLLLHSDLDKLTPKE